MPYTVEITTPPGEIAGEQRSSRLYQLPDSFTTVAEAKDAASTHITEAGLDPETVLFSVFDREGFTVASNADQPVEAG
jgi:hypothetical protein